MQKKENTWTYIRKNMPYLWQLFLNKTGKINLPKTYLYLKLEITIPTARENLACFTSDKISKHNIGPQETCETWRWPRHFIKETAAYYFMGYYIGEYLRAGRYPILNFKANIIDNVLIISCIPKSHSIDYFLTMYDGGENKDDLHTVFTVSNSTALFSLVAHFSLILCFLLH